MGLLNAGLMGLDDIIGRDEVTAHDAERNRLAAQAAIAAGLKPQAKPRRPRKAKPGVIPVGRSTWWEGVRAGRFPQPVRIGGRTLWRVEDIRALIASFS